MIYSDSLVGHSVGDDKFYGRESYHLKFLITVLCTNFLGGDLDLPKIMIAQRSKYRKLSVVYFSK